MIRFFILLFFLRFWITLQFYGFLPVCASKRPANAGFSLFYNGRKAAGIALIKGINY